MRDSTQPPLLDELQTISLVLRYARWFRWLTAVTIAGCIFFVLVPAYILYLRIAEGREEKEWVAISLLVLGFGAGAVHLLRHYRGLTQSVCVTKETISHGDVSLRWEDVISVWESAFFSMLRIKGRSGAVLVFFTGLHGYSFLAQLAEERKKANQSSQPTSLTRHG